MSHKYHYTYMITNLNNHKRYIGLRSSNCYPTNDIKYMGSCKNLKECIKKEGKMWFKKDILAIWYTRELAIEHEIRLHNYFEVGMNPMFYNGAKQTSTGFDVTGTKYSEEHNINLSKKLTGHLVSEQTKKKIRDKALINNKKEKNPMYGKQHSNETKQKLSSIRKKWYLTNEHPKPNIGRTWTDESNRKRSESLKGRKISNKLLNILKEPKSEEHKNNISKALKGHHVSNETKQKKRISMLNRKCINKKGINKMVKITDLQFYLEDGWILGKIKRNNK